VPEPIKVLEEIRHLLRQSGCLIFYVPFVYDNAPNPQDFWRFTPESIYWISKQCGFSKVTIIPLGDRWSTIADLILRGTPRLERLFAPIFVPFFFCLDKVYRIILKKIGKRLPPCPLGYVVLARIV